MNIITKGDVEKFLKLVKAGLKHGKSKEMRNYTASSNFDGTHIAKEYYVNIELSFKIEPEILEKLFAEDDFDLQKSIDDLMKDI